MKKLVPILLSGAILLGTTSCKKEDSSSGTTLQEALLSAVTVEVEEETKELVTLPREKTMYLVGFQWGDPSSFNPFNGWPAWPIRTEFNLMYEQLTSYNSMTGETEELLGRIETANNDYVSVILNNAAQWSDGTPLTAEDVLFTYNLNLTNGEAPVSEIQGFIKEVLVDTLVTETFDEDSTVVDTLKEARLTFVVDKEDRNNPTFLFDILSKVPILPKHVFQPKLNAANGSISALNEDMMGYAQVVSGPYNLEAFSNEKIILRRRDSYWGNKALHGGKMAQPEFLVHPIYKNNEASSNALKHGELDISSNYVPRIGMKQSNGVGTWFTDYPFFKPGASPMFIINTTKKPLNDRHYRRAMAFAIDYAKVAALGFSGYSDTIRSGLIMPFSAEGEEYYDQSEVDKYGATIFDPARAKEELKMGGYTSHFKDTIISKDGDTTFGNLVCMTDSKGDTLPTLEIMSPSGWTDFESIVKLAVKSMRVCGIDVREGFVDASQYWPAKNTGQFDLFMDTPASILTATMPWARLEQVISSAQWKPVNEKMYQNIGRFNKPGSDEYIAEIDSLLAAIPLMTSEEERKEGYKTLNRHFMEQQPTLPLLYRPEEFYQFSTKHWKNFPTAVKDEARGHGGPYLPPLMPVAGVGTKLLWEIEPVASTEEH